MGQNKKSNIKSIKKVAEDFYKKYNVQSFNVSKNDALKSNGNFKFVWDYKNKFNADVKTTSIY